MIEELEHDELSLTTLYSYFGEQFHGSVASLRDSTSSHIALNPRLIIAMGKERVENILKMTGLTLPPVIVWNRSQAATETALRERAAAARILNFFA